MARKDNFVDRRRPLTDGQKEMMMVVLIRNREAFDAVADQLRPEHFPPHDKKYAVLWAAVVGYFDENGDLPLPAYLTTEIQRRLEDDPDGLSEEEIESLDAFIGDFAFNFKDDELRPNFAIAKARQLMEDALHLQLTEVLSARDTPINLGNLLGQMQDQAATIASLDLSTELPFPLQDDDWRPADVSRFSTGVDFLDMYLDGGHAAKELITLMGPYGSCKTLLGLQVCISTGHLLYQDWVLRGRQGPCPVVYYASSEADIQELRLRAISYYACVRRESLWTSQAWDQQSTTGNLKEYEIALFGPDGPGERERIAAHKRLLNKFWCPLDLSCKDRRNPGRGHGGVDEIAALIRAEQRSRGNPRVGVVVVDYAQLIAERYISSKYGGDHNEMRHVVGRMPEKLIASIAGPLDTPVWLLAQFNKVGNSRNPGDLPKHTDCAEAANLGENADFAFVVGNKQEGNICLIGATKVRRAELRQATPVYIDGALNAVRNRSADLRVDPATRRIVKRGELSRVIGDSGEDSGSSRQRQAGDEVFFLGNQF